MSPEKKPRQIRVGTLLTAGLLLFAAGATVSAAIVGATHHAPPSHVYTVPKATASDAPTDTPTASPTPAATSQDTQTMTSPDPSATTTTSSAPAPANTTSSNPAPSVSSALPTAPVLAPPLQPEPAAQPPAPRCDPGQVAMWKDGAWVCVAVG